VIEQKRLKTIDVQNCPVTETAQTETARPNRPDQKTQTETVQTSGGSNCWGPFLSNASTLVLILPNAKCRNYFFDVKR